MTKRQIIILLAAATMPLWWGGGLRACNDHRCAQACGEDKHVWIPQLAECRCYPRKAP